MDSFGYVYLVVDSDEVGDIARNGLKSRPVRVEAEGEVLVDGFYFSTSAQGALRGCNPAKAHLLRFNVDNVAEITEIQDARNPGRSIDYVAAGPAAFAIPALEIDFRTPSKPYWRPLEGCGPQRTPKSPRAQSNFASHFGRREIADKLSA